MRSHLQTKPEDKQLYIEMARVISQNNEDYVSQTLLNNKKLHEEPARKANASVKIEEMSQAFEKAVQKQLTKSQKLY